ncbi:TRNA N6-adenosine threonylcarbamoyltransferase [Actinidia chinensis var. chinensis]|uniref:tRNA N6-adenosine threonylcarbamoyltransferase n=1 Tax=Actinidia chinensis var. chinensis TaxID=1590841 RepID=A0A2R6RLB2_ACTCC|nr:TRNA N6-adenosine threonylcarbamoyltransferase [Actinidia chinensis var. chinensis]
MRKLCPNFDREDGIETVLEVPIPEEMFTSMGSNVALWWKNMATWIKAQTSDKWLSPIIAGHYNELSFLLYVVGSPLIPLQEASIAKYIVQQYIAATEGQAAMNWLQSMCAIGQVKISASNFHQGDESVKVRSTEETGGFVLWQKNPDLWCLELLVSGCKGLDPRSIANLFLDAVCIGEKIINNEDCFILKLDTSKSALEAQNGQKYEIINHTIWGYFSQRSGLLVKFEDSRLLTVKTKVDDSEGVFWETRIESVIEDYKYVDGANIAHSGKTFVTVYRYGEQSANHRRELEETWKIEEVDFNIWDLSNDFFMPPSEIKKAKQT